jgi:hypothetical protein
MWNVLRLSTLATTSQLSNTSCDVLNPPCAMMLRGSRALTLMSTPLGPLTPPSQKIGIVPGGENAGAEGRRRHRSASAVRQRMGQVAVQARIELPARM